MVTVDYLINQHDILMDMLETKRSSTEKEVINGQLYAIGLVLKKYDDIFIVKSQESVKTIIEEQKKHLLEVEQELNITVNSRIEMLEEILGKMKS